MNPPTASVDSPPEVHASFAVYGPVTSRLPKLRPYFHQVRRRRPFIWELARSDLKAQHYDTFFGQLWLVLNPILMAAVWLVVREVIRPAGTPENRSAIIAHLIIGIFMYQYSSGLIGDGSRSIIGRKPMLLNSTFPRLVFPLVDQVKALVALAPTVVVYAVIHVALSQPVTWNVMWFPLIVAIQTVFTFGLMLLLATVTVYFRDTTNITRYVLRLGMFCSPILYTVSEIPENMLPYLQLNPFFPFFAAYENIFDGVPPEPTHLLWASLWAAATFVVGSVVFLRKERDFAIWL